MTKLWRKDRFHPTKGRKYFMEYRTYFADEVALRLYFFRNYHLLSSYDQNRQNFFVCLNKLIYRVAKSIGRPPSQLTSTILAAWVESRTLGIQEVMESIEQFDRWWEVAELGRTAARTGKAEDLQLYIKARR